MCKIIEKLNNFNQIQFIVPAYKNYINANVAYVDITFLSLHQRLVLVFHMIDAEIPRAYNFFVVQI